MSGGKKRGELAVARWTVDMANHVIVKNDKGETVGTFVVYAEWSTPGPVALQTVGESVGAAVRKGVRAHLAALINTLASRKERFK